MAHRFPIDATGWFRALAAHALAAIGFSIIHLVGMLGVRALLWPGRMFMSSGSWTSSVQRSYLMNLGWALMTVGLSGGARARLHDGVGLSNTRNRLECLYGPAHYLLKPFDRRDRFRDALARARAQIDGRRSAAVTAKSSKTESAGRSRCLLKPKYRKNETSFARRRRSGELLIADC